MNKKSIFTRLFCVMYSCNITVAEMKRFVRMSADVCEDSMPVTSCVVLNSQAACLAVMNNAKICNKVRLLIHISEFFNFGF